MEAAEIVDPKAISAKQVLFGATVTIVDENDKRRTFSIVGTDESDPDNGKISWLSPLAKALFKAKEGDIVTYNSPQGEKEAEILSILYKEIP